MAVSQLATQRSWHIEYKLNAVRHGSARAYIRHALSEQPVAARHVPRASHTAPGPKSGGVRLHSSAQRAHPARPAPRQPSAVWGVSPAVSESASVTRSDGTSVPGRSTREESWRNPMSVLASASVELSACGAGVETQLTARTEIARQTDSKIDEGMDATLAQTRPGCPGVDRVALAAAYLSLAAPKAWREAWLTQGHVVSAASAPRPRRRRRCVRGPSRSC